MLIQDTQLAQMLVEVYARLAGIARLNAPVERSLQLQVAGFGGRRAIAHVARLG